MVVRWARPGARFLAVLGAVIVAAAVAVMVAPGPIAREHVSRVATGAGLPVAAWGPVSGGLGRDDPAYRAAQAGAGFVARSPRQRLRAQFSPAGVSVRSGQALLGVRLRGYGYGARLRALGAIAPTARANRVLYRHGSLSEWYANGPLGLEQGFTLTARPAGRRVGPLTLAMALSGNARGMLSRGRGAVTFSHGGSSLSYGGLIVIDARGRTLPAWLQLSGGELLLRVRDAGARYPMRVDPFIQQAKLTASDGAANDVLSYSVAIQGDTVVAAAPFAAMNGNAGQGAVYVFVKPKSGWANATETAKLTASDGAAGDTLGQPLGLGSTSVGISGNTVVAGAFAAVVNGNANQGAVYVFVKPKGGWRSETEIAKLTASDGAAGDRFGSPVTVSHDTVVAGALFAAVNGNVLQGAVYVFVKPKRGWRSETETAKLTASDGAAGDDLGGSVGVSHDTVVAGSDCAVNGNHGQGAVYVFLKPKGGWRSETETAKLTASDGAFGDTLGVSAAISGDTVVAGAPAENGTPRPGAVYVFVKPRGGWRSETQTAKLTASDATADELFGSSAAISGDTVVAGAAFANVGAAYVFVEPRRGWANDTETAKLTASDGAAGDDLGVSVAVWHDTVVAGSGATINGNAGQGAAYVFGAGGSQSMARNATAARNTHRPPALPRSWYRLRRARRSARARGPRITTILARSRPSTASPVRPQATGRRAGIRRQPESVDSSYVVAPATETMHDREPPSRVCVRNPRPPTTHPPKAEPRVRRGGSKQKSHRTIELAPASGLRAEA